MAKEFLRVTRRMIFLKIATSKEALHTTVWLISKWAKIFSDSDYYRQKPRDVFVSGDKLIIWA